MSVAQMIASGRYSVAPSANRRVWRERDAEATALFWTDVEAEFNAARYPAAQWERIRNLAWLEGHADGLHAVLMWVQELTELVDTK